MESAKRTITATATLSYSSIADGATEELTAAVPGAKLGQVASVSAPTLEAGLLASAYVSAADVVTVRVTNASGGAVDPADSQAFYLSVDQP